MAETQKERDADKVRAEGLHDVSKGDHPKHLRGSWEHKALEEARARESKDAPEDPILGRRGRPLGKNGKPLLLNLGCGLNKFSTHINVDAYGEPDALWDLNKTPYPWPDDTFDGIDCFHVMEHLENWWGAFSECARILKPGGYFQIRVPDESSRTALTYRDHLRVFSEVSFHGILGMRQGTNAWAETEKESVPLKMQSHMKVPFPEYQWMAKWAPWLLRFCANHLRNFIWEQRFVFVKRQPGEEAQPLRDIR